MQLCSSNCLGRAHRGKLIKDRCGDIELGHLALKRPSHHLLAQTLEAIHLRLHQRPSAVPAPAVPNGPPQLSARLDYLIAMSKRKAFA